MKRNVLIMLTAAAALAANLSAQPSGWPPSAEHPTIAVWPGLAPGAPTNLLAEADMTTAKDNVVAGRPVVRLGNVVAPTLTLYKPKGHNSGAAVVVFPCLLYTSDAADE